MPPERIDLSQRALSQRADPAVLAEWMDAPCSYEELRGCLIDIARMNRVTLGYRPTLRWLDHVLAVKKPVRPLHIVDVGCGGGDMLRQIARWARVRGVAVKLTGIDLNPHAVRAAKEFSADDASVEWISGDARSYVPSGGIDIVLSSLVMHHLSDPEIVRFLAWMESSAELGWFINDLERRAHHLYGFKLLAKLCGWHRFVQHDGPVSFRRSFRRQDWQRMCAEAGLARNAVSIETRLPGRLCVGRIK